MDANETDALFWRRLLAKYMARVYHANINRYGLGHTFVTASSCGPSMTDEEERMLAAQIEQEISHKPNEDFNYRINQ